MVMVLRIARTKFLCLLALSSSSLLAEMIDLSRATFQEVLDNYSFIADFEPKTSVRSISKELFWKYPFIAPRTHFSLDRSFGEDERELIASHGSGRAFQHMNKGRILFRQRAFDEARRTWLTGRARFGKAYPLHRRNDYFIGLGFLKLAYSLDDRYKGDLSKDQLRLAYANAATFLSWAFIVKKDLRDDFLDEVTPKALYHLASVYFLFGRYTAAHGAAREGLDFLRRTGRKSHRHKLRRMVAEMWIRNSSYLEAVQELDTAIRQDPQIEEVAESFGRVGDIFFDLNNYEIASDIYGISQNLDRIAGRVPHVERLMLRGESLFWLGRLREAQVAFASGLHEAGGVKLNPGDALQRYQAWAQLRLADIYLARYDRAVESNDYSYSKPDALLEDAKLSYFRVSRLFPGSEPAKIAQVRHACLGLPVFKGRNIHHSRRTLEAAMKWPIAQPALELAMACYVSSYSRRELTPRMVEKVRSFASRYPKSRYIKTFIEPVRKVKAAQLDKYLQSGAYQQAILYFESYRTRLFQQLNATRRLGLFKAYVYEGMSGKASEFWSPVSSEKAAPLEMIRRVVFLAEQRSVKPSMVLSKSRSYAKRLESLELDLKVTDELLDYINRLKYSKFLDVHIRWLLGMVSRFDDAKFDASCRHIYPLLSRWYDQVGADKRHIWQQLRGVIDSRLPDLITKDKSCSFAYLDLEAKFAQLRPLEYGRLWLKRTEWPAIPVIASHLWAASEILADQGDLEGAQTIWSVLSTRLPDAFPEKSLARIRLDSSQTEYGSLWER